MAHIGAGITEGFEWVLMLSVETVAQIGHLDFEASPFVCEMRWGRQGAEVTVCSNEATAWLVFISRTETVCRKLACPDCIKRSQGQGRAIDTRPIEW